MSYLTPDVIADDTAVAEGILAAIADRLPGWQPSDGSPETALAESVGIAIATAVSVLLSTTQATYDGFGATILQILRDVAVPATCVSTWTIADVDGIFIPGGTQVTLTLADGTPAGFVVAADVQVPAGTSVQLGVELIALDAGTVSNGATNPAAQVELDRVLSVTIDAPAAAGTDDETDDAFSARLADRARRLHAIPITAADYAAFATDVPGVARTAVLNLFDPGDPLVVSTGHITLYSVDAAGAALDSDHKTAVADYFAAIETPLNVTVHQDDPTLVDLTITATVKGAADFDDAAVEAACIAAINTAFDPAVYDVDQDADGGWRRPRSVGVSIFDIAAVLDDLPEVESVTDITVNAGTVVTFVNPVSLPHMTADATITVT